ncbi:hypothetical protein BST81_14190 [Leptolyngbya sp. 'hensonii']|uniref:DUF4278 domain-containing protein n=1 Tax=Leptolyngbya sp. 'hensonii' TaxID=1922337 RepID=UPI00094FFC5F|nr:DUF4278 domain-containing protein [Leptolyngbya sp. 'hensonii']OLP18162.1 hypothetical protein BST81_14190 [Leptolyngbya sp. 'hensonii']
MQLTYRGVVYDYNPPAVTVANDGVTRKYAGLTWLVQALRRFSKHETDLEVKYRGAADRASEKPIPSLEEKARLLVIQHHLSDRHRQLSMHSRVAAQLGIPA